jgi:hypothetical protein
MPSICGQETHRILLVLRHPPTTLWKFSACFTLKFCCSSQIADPHLWSFSQECQCAFSYLYCITLLSCGTFQAPANLVLMGTLHDLAMPMQLEPGRTVCKVHCNPRSKSQFKAYKTDNLNTLVLKSSHYWPIFLIESILLWHKLLKVLLHVALACLLLPNSVNRKKKHPVYALVFSPCLSSSSSSA